jgi:predicted alpha/beta-fold hydrolase
MFAERAPWWGGHLQTLRNTIVRSPIDLSPWPGRRLVLAMTDGSGDRLVATLHEPGVDEERALAVLIHGLTGCENSAHVRSTAQILLRLGRPVLRLNLRGAGPSRRLCRFHYHAGRSEDLRDALHALAAAEPRLVQRGLLLVGYSLGGSMLLKFLAEHGCEPAILAAVSVSAPIELEGAIRRIMEPRNRVYHRYLLGRMKLESLAAPGGLEKMERESVWSARSIYEFDHRITAPRNGFTSADHYYRATSARQFMRAVETPTLVIHALDDPWIPAAPYLSFPWRENLRLAPLISATGGHVGFHGRGSRIPWHDRCIAHYFEHVQP